MITLYPMADGSLVDEEAEATMAAAQAAIVAVRNLRAEYNLSPAAPLDVTILVADEAARARLDAESALIAGMARTGRLAILAGGEPPTGTLVSVAGDAQVCVAVAGQIDKGQELARIDKELAKAEKDLQRVQGKLGSESFVAKAPPAVVDEERRRLAENQERIAKLTASRERIARL
jgi:valyl-tRNA synthetase